MPSAKGVNTNNEWYTPWEPLERVRELFGGVIDLDPASCDRANAFVQATEYFDELDDGLEQEWHGKVFLNPPFSAKLLGPFLEKAMEELINVDELVILTNSGTDTKWNQIMCSGLQAYTIGRLRFMYPNGDDSVSTSRGQVFTYFGENHQKFIDIFTKDNFCWIPNKTYFA